MTILLILLTAGVCITALFRPWIGVVAYYLTAIMVPQGIWPWIFGDLRVSLFIALASILGCLIGIFTGKISLNRINNKFSIALAVIYIFVLFSHWFSPFKNHPLAPRMLDPDTVLSVFNKAVLFYFVAVLCIDTKAKLKWMCFMLVGVFTALTYWANKIYLTGQLWLYNDNGRLSGPGALYSDENAFGMVFVVGSAFIYFIAQQFNAKFMKYGIWLVLPLLWHAIFLTGSRGALVAVGFVAIYVAVRSKSKWIGAGVLFAFVIALVWQGRDLLDRTVNTGNEELMAQEEVIDPRILSWKMGGYIMTKYPFLGVGFNRFQQASQEFSDGVPYVAHNTFLQFAANSGIICGVLYLYFFWWAFKMYRANREHLNAHSDKFYALSFDAILGGLVGFFMSAVFLDLMVYEIFYCLLALLVAWNNVYLVDGERERLGGGENAES